METRTLLILGILGFATAGIANSIWFGLDLKRYSERTQILATRLDMLRFKKVVARQMYAALIQAVLLIVPLVIFFTGVSFEILNPSEILLVIVPSVIMIFVAVFSRRWEYRVKTIAAADPEIEEQRDAIVRTWLRKPWPDW
jgi:hypothetical protein